MKEKTKYVIRIVATLFLVIGCVGFFAGAITAVFGSGFRNLESFEHPHGDHPGNSVDKEGKIYFR